jgi:heme-degrading monooxygenase HmoA
MIARIWHGVTPAAKADEYYAYLRRTGLVGYKATPGNRGTYARRRIEGDQAHFLMLTFWDSLDAVKAFAGPDVEKARYYDLDAQYLLELEPTVQHYEVAES